MILSILTTLFWVSSLTCHGQEAKPSKQQLPTPSKQQLPTPSKQQLPTPSKQQLPTLATRHIALDFEGLLVKPKQHDPYEGVGRFLSALLTLNPRPQLYILSTKDESIIRSAFERIKLLDGTPAISVIKKIINPAGAKKDLAALFKGEAPEVIATHMRETVLIDDIPDNAFSGQKKNFLAFPDPKFGETPPNYEFILGTLNEAWRERGSGFLDKLHSLSWNKDGKPKFIFDDVVMFPDLEMPMRMGRAHLEKTNNIFERLVKARQSVSAFNNCLTHGLNGPANP